jgi:hypothetical protein
MPEIDRAFEGRLRAALREDADEQPFTITLERLEADLSARRRSASLGRIGLLATAASAIVAIGLGALLLRPAIAPPVGQGLDELAPFAELEEFVDTPPSVNAITVLREERAAQPSDTSIHLGATGARMGLDVYWACTSGRTMNIEILDGDLVAGGIDAECEPGGQGFTHFGSPATRPSGFAVRVTAPAGTAWRLIAIDRVVTGSEPVGGRSSSP